MKLQPNDLNWLLSCAGVTAPQQRRVMQLRYVDGYEPSAIAADLEITPGRVRGYISEAWAAVDAWRQSTAPDAMIEFLVERLRAHSDTETLRQHARALLDALRGRRHQRPYAPTLDDVERPVANHDPLIDIQDVERLLRNWDWLQGREPEDAELAA